MKQHIGVHRIWFIGGVVEFNFDLTDFLPTESISDREMLKFYFNWKCIVYFINDADDYPSERKQSDLWLTKYKNKFQVGYKNVNLKYHFRKKLGKYLHKYVV